MNQKQRHAKLERYRAQQKRIAYERDGGMCVFCGAPAVDPHHVYGRASTWQDDGSHEERERADKLLCVCRSCHDRCHGVRQPVISKA